MSVFGQGLRALAVVLLFGSGIVSGAGGSGEIAWRHDFGSARREAARIGRSVVVIVESPGCTWCRELERTTLRDPRVVELLNGATVPLKIDASDPAQESLVEALGVQAVPAIAVVAPSGRIVLSRSGFLPPAGLLELLLAHVR